MHSAWRTHSHASCNLEDHATKRSHGLAKPPPTPPAPAPPAQPQVWLKLKPKATAQGEDIKLPCSLSDREVAALNNFKVIWNLAAPESASDASASASGSQPCIPAAAPAQGEDEWQHLDRQVAAVRQHKTNLAAACQLAATNNDNAKAPGAASISKSKCYASIISSIYLPLT